MTELETVLAELLRADVTGTSHDGQLHTMGPEMIAKILAPHIERAFRDVRDGCGIRGTALQCGTESLREALNDER